MVRLLELETTALGREELKEKDCGAGVSNAENLGREKMDLFCRFKSFVYSIYKNLCLSWNTLRNKWSTMIYLSFKFSFTVGGEGAARLWGVGDGAGATTADGLMEGVKEKAEGADGVSEGGLEAKEKLDVPEPNGVGPPREKAEAPAVEFVVGTEKVKDDDDDDTGAEGGMLNGAADE